MTETHVVRLEIPVSARARAAGLASLLLFGLAAEVASESVTLTTYYPAPSGVYNQMITTDNTYLARDRGRVGIGTTNPGVTTDSKLTVDTYNTGTGATNGTALTVNVNGTRGYALNVWAYGGGQAWTMYDGANNGWNPGLSQALGRVGVQNTNPQYPLDVNGDARASQFRWQNSILQSDQGGAIELGGNNGVAGVGVPYIDFHLGGYGVQDYNVRMINDSNGTVHTYGNQWLSAGNGRGYLYVDNVGTACGWVGYGGDGGGGTGVCNAGQYATQMPGIWVEGWLYENQTPFRFTAINNWAYTSTTVLAQTPGDSYSPWQNASWASVQYTGTGGIYCCWK